MFEEAKNEMNSFKYKIINEKKQSIMKWLCCCADESDSDDD